MNPLDREAYLARYATRFSEFGHDERTLGWRPGSQQVRFEALCRNVKLTGISSILDVGCGFGDLSGYLRAQGYHGEYLGLDFSPELIEAGKKKYPGEQFLCADFQQHEFGRQFDFVLASGTFNSRLRGESQSRYVRNTLRKMFDLCHVAAAADFLSVSVDYRRQELAYYAPERVLKFARSLTRRVLLRHDDMPFEFSICMFRKQEFDDRNVFLPAEIEN